jgi:hypothetical protein
MPQPPPQLPHPPEPEPPHPPWRPPPGLAVLGPRPRTARPRTRRPPRRPPSGTSTPPAAASQAQPVGPSPVGIAVSPGTRSQTARSHLSSPWASGVHAAVSSRWPRSELRPAASSSPDARAIGPRTHYFAPDARGRPGKRPVGTALSPRLLIRPPWPVAATMDENRGMPGQARLSLVRQSPLITRAILLSGRGRRFKSSQAHEMTPEQRKRWSAVLGLSWLESSLVSNQVGWSAARCEPARPA